MKLRDYKLCLHIKKNKLLWPNAHLMHLQLQQKNPYLVQNMFCLQHSKYIQG